GGVFAKSDLTPVQEISPTPKMNYELPYPGLLPDSPIYFLRIIRDKIIDLLIADPLKKSDFYLLQADKRLNAGISLFNKGKFSLALSTISKAENYLEKALEKTMDAQEQGMDIKDIKRRLTNSVVKHKEELDKLIKKANKEFKVGFEKEQKRVIAFQEKLNK
ncbi:MAG: DUF5667 domain-containing protein, partial [bacterium]|nr:DUF5667 domain-containing protein [bacterium]